jgi:type IV pilus assembly protein PilW
MAKNMTRRSRPPAAAAGFGLVETMVALVIGMLATFIIMQVFATSESRKRTTTGGADAQTDAAVALYLMERDLRQAGYGLSPNPEDFVPTYTAPPTGVLTNGILGQCANVRAHNENRTNNPDFVYDQDTFAPVVINPPNIPAGDANTDVVLVNYAGTGGMIGKGIPLANQNGGTTQAGGAIPDYVVDKILANRAGFMQGDMILAVPPAGTGLDCTLGEITGLPGGSGCTVTGTDPDQVFINHNDVSYPSVYTGCDQANMVNAAWNMGGNGIVTYNAGSRVYNLGAVGAFVSRVYAVRGGKLTVCDLTTSNCAADPPVLSLWTPVVAGVVGFRAQYGKDTNFDGTIEAWDATRPTGAARAQVVAMRLAVVVRSGQYEKDVVTAAAPVWRQDATSTSNANIDVTGYGTDWQHYRYKVAQSIVPLRNMIWGQQN